MLCKILIIYLNIVIPLNMFGRERQRSLPGKGSHQVKDDLRPTIYGPRTMGWHRRGKLIINTGHYVT